MKEQSRQSRSNRRPSATAASAAEQRVESKRARHAQRSAILRRLASKLGPELVAKAQTAATEFAAYNIKSAELTTELNSTLPQNLLEATDQAVSQGGTKPLPSDPAERIELLRRIVKHMPTGTPRE